MSEDYELDEKCNCGGQKKIQDLFCNRCQKQIQEDFKRIMQKKFNREEIEYLGTIIDEENITDFIFGKE